jgi:hypothetical protein
VQRGTRANLSSRLPRDSLQSLPAARYSAWTKRHLLLRLPMLIYVKIKDAFTMYYSIKRIKKTFRPARYLRQTRRQTTPKVI